MRPRRILMTVDAVGGVWQYACDLGAALRPLGIETIMVSLGPAPGAAQRRDLPEGCRLVETDLDLDWLAANATVVEASGRTIAALADQFAVDLVHLNQPALAAAAEFTKPVVTTVHSCVATWWQAVRGGEAPASFAWQTDLVTRGLRRCDAVVAPSRAFAEMVRRNYALATLPYVVPNGRNPLRGDAPMEDAAFTAGRLWDEGKNVATLDRVASRLSCPLRAAGATRGPQGESVTLRHIEALGPLDTAAIAARLASRPIFVSAARYEPFGLAILEAASAGCALVLADIPTLRETWDGVAAFVAPSDEDGFVAAIEALLRDRAWREHRGKQARRRAEPFIPARTAVGMQAVYARAFSRRHADLETA